MLGWDTANKHILIKVGLSLARLAQMILQDAGDTGKINFSGVPQQYLTSVPKMPEIDIFW